MKKLFTICLIFLMLTSQAQVITTYAGTGVTGFYGDGGPCSMAAFYHAEAIYFDKSGAMYIADSQNNRIRKIENDTITTIAGTYDCDYEGDGGSATFAKLCNPNSLTIDRKGNLYLMQGGGGWTKIRMIDTGGVITTIAGKYPMNGSCTACDADSVALNTASGLSTDSKGNLYFTEIYEGRIRKIDSSGIIHTIYTCPFPAFPYSTYVNKNDELFFFNGGSLKKIDSTGAVIHVAGSGTGYSGDGGPAQYCKFKYPGIITGDSLGNLYIGDASNYRLRKIDTAGIINTICGTGTDGFSGDGGDPLLANIGVLSGIQVRPDGQIYISDNNRIRRIGNITTAISSFDKVSEIQVYPNPSSGLMHVNFAEPESKVSVIDVLGRNIFSYINTDAAFDIDLSHCSPGVYSLNVKGSKKSTVFKLIVQ
ncbi:MAG: T9SS type A sorting domain-containing protein [Bacteroidetes bacterium]|nr:T9SS type A sorting domain-containing protein [Bacteroidota bacterium]